MSFDRSHTQITGGSRCAAQPQPTRGRNSTASASWPGCLAKVGGSPHLRVQVMSRRQTKLTLSCAFKIQNPSG
eukprot:2806656-Amphidinium_carterae.1